MTGNGYSSPPLVRWTAAVLGTVLALGLVANGAVTLLDVTARAQYTTATTTYPVRSGTLTIDADGGRVVLVRAPAGARLGVRARVTGGLVSPDVSQRYRGGRLALRAPCPGVLVIFCGARWRVAVPDGTRVRVEGEADLEADGVRPRGTLVLRSAGGDVHVRGSVPRVDAESAGGDVHLELETAPRAVRAVTRGGDAHVELPDVAYAVDAVAGGGDRRVQVAEDRRSRRRVTVRTNGGDVRVQARGR